MASSKLTFWNVLQRKKVYRYNELDSSNLKRCLNSWDITALGLGSTLGVGVYVIIGSVALNVAGPSILLSFLIAAVASLFSGLCYAEFSARIPKAGSAYTYAYVALGECAAFIIGWSLILEYLFGIASIARGLSYFVDSLAGQAMSEWFLSFAPISGDVFSPYFDFFAFFAVIVFGGFLSFGVRLPLSINNVFVGINMVIILFVIVAGAFMADAQNWSIPEWQVPEGRGEGGFFPYGARGVLRGAALCCYGFAGFDTISYTAEEVERPQRSIPKAIIIGIGVALLAYSSLTIILTMMVPYFLQDRIGAIATCFSQVGWEWAWWIVSIGAVFGVSASLIGAFYPLPRLLYSMASDGFLFNFLSKIKTKRKSPIAATLLPIPFIAILAGMLELDQLVLMLSVGTLLSYTAVAASVIVMRYRSNFEPVFRSNLVSQVFGCGDRTANRSSTKIVVAALVLFIVTCITLALVVIYMTDPLIPVAVLNALALVLIIVIAVQPKAYDGDVMFKTPLVPVIPCLSIYCNVHLLVLVSGQTWIRAAVWLGIGILIYIISILCCKTSKQRYLEEYMTSTIKPSFHGNNIIKITVESPTPPETLRSNQGEISAQIIATETTQTREGLRKASIVTEEIIVQQAVVDYNEEKEAIIINLLDQVIQEEEETYGEVESLNEIDAIAPIEPDLTHGKSFSESSDAGSEASLSHTGISKYDVTAQVHREDMPQLNEEVTEQIDDENIEMGTINSIVETENIQTNDNEITTNFSDLETNSRTDESGYSDSTENNLNDVPDDAPRIPTPPPFDESYFANTSPILEKAFTISAGTTKPKFEYVEQELEKPRESVQSNSSSDDSNMIFGSARQMSFMSKLNGIFQTKITQDFDEPLKEEHRRRSNSTGDITETNSIIDRERPVLFMNLKKELLSRHSLKLKSVENEEEVESKAEVQKEDADETDSKSLSKEDLKSKLESMFATGGPKPFKPRPAVSNPPTPEEASQTDVPSTEAIPTLPKVEKNDTLKRQKDKFGQVLNSIRLSFNSSDAV